MEWPKRASPKRPVKIIKAWYMNNQSKARNSPKPNPLDPLLSYSTGLKPLRVPASVEKPQSKV